MLSRLPKSLSVALFLAPLAVVACGDDTVGVGGAGGTVGTSTHAATSTHTAATSTSGPGSTASSSTHAASSSNDAASSSDASTASAGGAGGAGATSTVAATGTSVAASSSSGGGTEICDNGIDDDGDGAIDCGDTDCVGVGSCPPVVWTCNPNYYGDASCDCGCGSVDIDCADATNASCDFCGDTGSCSPPPGLNCPAAIDPVNNAICIAIPPENCTNGVDDDFDGDVDCDDHGCFGVGACPTPAGWTCDAADYADGTICNCGCGIADPDCADATIASCDECNATGSCNLDFTCPGNINTTNNALCSPPPPEDCSNGTDDDFDGDTDCDDTDCLGVGTCPPVGWVCSPSYYASGIAGDCDCGCGAVDPDCADATPASCDYCADDMGSCANNIDCSLATNLDPTNNGVCLP